MKTKVVITVDTEFSNHKDDMGISGRINGEEYGLSKIREILNKYGIKATFFVDVYTNKLAYIDFLKEQCLNLKRDGHDLQLHTHPNGMFDKHRGSMKDYSLDEQENIIKQGKARFREWFGVEPVAHRAGDWGANTDTLRALVANGIYFDSSFFFERKGCLINPSDFLKNLPSCRHGVCEIPATIFQTPEVCVFSKFRLLSTNGNCSYEVEKVINNLRLNSIPVICLVYHSFSFLKWDKGRQKYFFSRNNQDKFEKMIARLTATKDFEFTTIHDIAKDIQLYLDQKNEYVPRVGIFSTLLRILDRFQC